jgi:hypothetical protein
MKAITSFDTKKGPSHGSIAHATMILFKLGPAGLGGVGRATKVCAIACGLKPM